MVEIFARFYVRSTNPVITTEKASQAVRPGLNDTTSNCNSRVVKVGQDCETCAVKVLYQARSFGTHMKRPAEIQRLPTSLRTGGSGPCGAAGPCMMLEGNLVGLHTKDVLCPSQFNLAVKMALVFCAKFVSHQFHVWSNMTTQAFLSQVFILPSLS